MLGRLPFLPLLTAKTSGQFLRPAYQQKLSFHYDGGFMVFYLKMCITLIQIALDVPSYLDDCYCSVRSSITC